MAGSIHAGAWTLNEPPQACYGLRPYAARSIEPSMTHSYSVEWSTVDGIPVFWSNVEGPRVAALMFRVGRADELAAIGGITHLIEHLALVPLAQAAYEHNGLVTPIKTVFHATGTEDQLVDFLGDVCRSLASLPMDRIGVERRILLQEAQPQSLHGVVRHLRTAAVRTVSPGSRNSG